MTTEMIERVAKGMAANVGENFELHSFWYLDQAKVAIRMMREPTEEMIIADDVRAEEIKRIWKAMIEKALDE